jgi:hypothetical protein
VGIDFGCGGLGWCFRWRRLLALAGGQQSQRRESKALHQ